MIMPEDRVLLLRDRIVVIDLVSPFVVLGKLVDGDHRYLQVADADVHDLRDAKSTREAYVVESKISGVKVNRRQVYVPRDQVVSIGALDDVVS